MSSTQVESYVIFNPVYREIKKYIKRKTGYRNFIINTWNVCLYAREDILDMKLLWVRADSVNLVQFIDRLILESDGSLPWQKFPNIIVPSGEYQELMDFIGFNKLWHYVVKIETKINVAILRTKMKVVTFHPRIRMKNILPGYKRGYPNFMGLQTNLFIAKAYEWLTPEALKHFKIKIRYRYTHVVIYLLLDYYRKQRRRRNSRILNLYDLCSLRLAMFDPRYYQFDQCEIPGLIHTELSTIIEHEKKFNKNFIFNPCKYLVENGVHTKSKNVLKYFLFCVSSYTKYEDIVSETNNFSTLVRVMDYVRLYTENFYSDYLIDFIEKRPYAQIMINGDQTAMNAALIFKIMSFPCVIKLVIDTNFPVLFDGADSKEIDNFSDLINISFCGDNENQTMENCLTPVKAFLTFRPHTLYIQCPVVDYSIFNEISATEISFLKHNITAKMISELNKTELTETIYSWKYSTLANDPNVLRMLDEFRLVRGIEVVQDENTFPLIFGFIEQQFLIQNLSEFSFKWSFTVIYKSMDGLYEWPFKIDDYVFRLNQHCSKIEMVSRTSDDVVDVYELLGSTNSEEMNFDFYQ